MMTPGRWAAAVVTAFLCAAGAWAEPAVYEVGPAKPFEAVGEVPWEALEPGDMVLIHHRPEPYREKWVICRAGTEQRPITVRGVPGPDGQLPVIDGRDAVTRPELNFWNEARSIIKIGGANRPPDTLPEHIIVENLEVRSARPGFTFTGRAGVPETYASNAAPIFIEKGRHITLRNCVLHDSGNGLFIASGASEVLAEGCHIYGNGIEGSIYEHNSYTQASGLTFQFNRYGRLREGLPRQQPQRPLLGAGGALQLDRGRQPAARPRGRRGRFSAAGRPRITGRPSSTGTCCSTRVRRGTIRWSTTAATAPTRPATGRAPSTSTTTPRSP
jgi:hypothetical protein